MLTAAVFLPTPHTGGDNAGYISLAHSLLDRGTYQELWDPLEPAHTKYPPLFPLLLAGVMALGVKGWVGLKSLSFGATLAAGLFTFLWVRGRAGVLMGLGVGLVFALSDGVLYYSRWILSDPVFLALTVGALWALDRYGDLEDSKPMGRAGVGESSGGGAEGDGASGAGPRSGVTRLWLGFGLALVILAYFTRSAGLPLVVATLLWLGLRRRWRALSAFLVAFGLPAALWWFRGRIRGGGDYVAEFWLLDPYRPELGRVGAGGLFLRVWENLVAYVTEIIPEGLVGGDGSLLPVLGVGLVALALVGWADRLRKGPGVAELFFPLYSGLILLWPQVWSGDRFALPLFPLLLFFAVTGLAVLSGRLGSRLGELVLAGAFLVMVLPAGKNWMTEAGSAADCRRMAAGGDPWACQPVNVREYVLMAGWSGANLPDRAAVITRKPRIFYVLSGVKTLSLPLTTDVGIFLSAAQEKGARYLTMDRWDGLSGYYLPGILSARPEAFCTITGVEVGGEMGVRLLGIRDPEGAGVGGASLERCPGVMLASEPRIFEPVPPGAIPLLVLN